MMILGRSRRKMRKEKCRNIERKKQNKKNKPKRRKEEEKE